MKPAKILIRILLIAALILLILTIVHSGKAESQETAVFKVQTRLLNGRSAPRKTASIEARFDYGDELISTGEWSNDHKWVEVYGGETGTVWVSIRYISEKNHFTAKNRDYKEVKVRKWPENGKVVRYLKKGQTVEIEQVILGWGKTKYGWVDLYYLEEEG